MMTGQGWEAEMYTEALPVQVVGMVDGFHFFFHCRDTWGTFSVGTSPAGAMAAFNEIESPEALYRREGEELEPHWFEPRPEVAAWARERIEDHLALFRAWAAAR